MTTINLTVTEVSPRVSLTVSQVTPSVNLTIGTEGSGTGPQGPQGETGPQGPQGIQGEKGDTGDAGAPGTDGATWRDGSGAPSNSVGVDGDYYIDVATQDIYKKTSGTYSIVGTFGEHVKMLTSHVTTTSDSLGNVTGLFFPIAANEKWIFDFKLMNGCSGAGGIKFGIDVPTGATYWAHSKGMSSGITGYTSQRMSIDETPTGNVYNNVVSTGGWTEIFGGVQNGANAGNVQLQFMSVTAGQTSTVYNYSSLIAKKVG